MSDIANEIEKVLRKLPAAEQVAVKAKLARVITHRQAILRFPTPGHLGQFLRPGFLQTPMLDRIDWALMSAATGEHTRWIINTPPQEGKTTRLQDGALWMLLRNPALRIGFASYEQGIAAQSGLAVRQFIETHGSGYRGQGVAPDREDALGLMLDPDRAQQTNWFLADVPGGTSKGGGILSVGIGSALTGRPLDVLVIDDPLKDAKQADSPVYRRAVKDWFQAVASTRLAPGAIVIVVQTRWHEDDLTGWLRTEDATRPTPVWRHLNIRAQAVAEDPERGIGPDPLGREPGEFLISARGRTLQEWQDKISQVGTRWWYALYQGDPTPPEGGAFKRHWFDRHRVGEAPALAATITVIDPADNDGTGDEAGIITAGLAPDGDVYILRDDSGHYTIAQWVRVAILQGMCKGGASRIYFEKSLSRLRISIQKVWKEMHRQARELARANEHWKVDDHWGALSHPNVIAEAAIALSDEDDSPEERSELRHQLEELWPHVPRLLQFGPAGPPVKTIVAQGSKSQRADLVSPMFETGQVHMVGKHPHLEHQMAVWLPTQDSPDRMDAAVHAVNVLMGMAANARIQRAPADQRVPVGRPRQMPQIQRTTRYR